MKIKLTKLKCMYPSCGHEWYPRREKPPKVCPVCKRTGWATKDIKANKE